LRNTVHSFFSLVKFSHTVFAMPFALLAFFAATHYYSYTFEWIKLVLILICMVLARNAAMAFNRYIDRHFDLKNPRTRLREIPNGIIKTKTALYFVVINSVLFVVASGFINTLCLILSPLALLLILGYSFTKRFTSLSHLVLGLALSAAPFGAFIAVAGEVRSMAVFISGAVWLWVAGFDIIYSLQDEKFDRENHLFSIPVSMGGKTSLIVAQLLHFFSAALVVSIAIVFNLSIIYYIGAAVFIAMIIWQHILVYGNNHKHIGLAFGTANGIASIIFGVCGITDFLMYSTHYTI